MTIKEKLQLIQRLTRLSQEKMAIDLKVSFPTLNSWINGRSIPRVKAQGRIDELFGRLTGRAVIPDDLLEAKKQAILKKGRNHGCILQKIAKNKDIFDQFILSLTYNTNRIEGSTLTESETAAILFEDSALPNKSIIEQMEVKNHQAALRYVFRHLQNKRKLDELFLLKLHGILLNGIQEDAGQYRNHGVRIVGSNVPTSNPLKIPSLMKVLIKDINKKPRNILSHAVHIHSRFEQIHPFSDGNGRVGRLILDAMFIAQNLPPPIIRQEKRRFYIIYLNKAQIDGEFSQLENFISDAVLDAFDIFNNL